MTMDDLPYTLQIIRLIMVFCIVGIIGWMVCDFINVYTTYPILYKILLNSIVILALSIPILSIIIFIIGP